MASGGRTGALRWVTAFRRRGLLLVGSGVTADLLPFIAEPDARARLLEQERATATIDPDVLSGSEPVVRGTRGPVRDVAAGLAASLPLADIMASYTSLFAEQIEFAALYASVERLRGKPRRPLDERPPLVARLLS